MTDMRTAVSGVNSKPMSHRERLRLIYAMFPAVQCQARGHSSAPRRTLQRQYAEDGEFDVFNRNEYDGL